MYWIINRSTKTYGSGGIRTHAIEMTGALNQRLRPLGHATLPRLIVIKPLEEILISYSKFNIHEL